MAENTSADGYEKRGFTWSREHLDWLQRTARAHYPRRSQASLVREALDRFISDVEAGRVEIHD